MLGVLILVLSVVPLAVGVYAWKAFRDSDERGPDDPPPPPDPERPLPIIPPSERRRDRGPSPPPRLALKWRARRTVC